MQKLQVLGLVYFCYLFLFSGLEFTLSFLTHQRFHFTRCELRGEAVFSAPTSSKHTVAEQEPCVCLHPSMQQGKMFFFIGVTMALIQGGYARRIKPGRHIKAVRMVGVPSDCVTMSLAAVLRKTRNAPLHICPLYEPFFSFVGNHGVNPSFYRYRALVEYNDSLRRLGLILIWWAHFTLCAMLTHTLKPYFTNEWALKNSWHNTVTKGNNINNNIVPDSNLMQNLNEKMQ